MCRSHERAPPFSLHNKGDLIPLYQSRIVLKKETFYILRYMSKGMFDICQNNDDATEFVSPAWKVWNFPSFLSLLLTTSAAIYLYCNLKGQSNCFCNSTRLTRDQILNSTAQDMHIGFQTHLCLPLLGWTALFRLTAMEHFAHCGKVTKKSIIFYARIPLHDNFQNWNVSERGFQTLWIQAGLLTRGLVNSRFIFI